MEEYPKYEKVDNKTLKITEEKQVNVPIQDIIKKRTTFIQQKDQIEHMLMQIDAILENAKRLGLNTELENIPETK